MFVWLHSDPNGDDSDGDGIPDGEDTAPFTKGLEGGIVGKMYFVGCDGHSFLVYNSYIEDSINMRNFDRIYTYSSSRDAFSYTGREMEYEMRPNDYITISLSANTSREIAFFGGFADYFFSNYGSNAIVQGGIKCNWELSLLCEDIKNNQRPNAFLSLEIKNNHLRSVEEMWNDNNYYNVFGHNCTGLVINTWNMVSSERIPYTYFPLELKGWLQNHQQPDQNPKEYDLEPILNSIRGE